MLRSRRSSVNTRVEQWRSWRAAQCGISSNKHCTVRIPRSPSSLVHPDMRALAIIWVLVWCGGTKLFGQDHAPHVGGSVDKLKLVWCFYPRPSCRFGAIIQSQVLLAKRFPAICIAKISRCTTGQTFEIEWMKSLFRTMSACQMSSGHAKSMFISPTTIRGGKLEDQEIQQRYVLWR